jgi:predicted AAA+ superfamily ATPase
LQLFPLKGIITYMLIERSNQALIEQSFANPAVTAILGPRRTGKSTLVKNYMEKNPDNLWLCYNMDLMVEREPMERGELRANIEQRILRSLGKTAKVWVVIDEAQKCPALFEQIKALYDDFKDKDVIKFIITGSGILNLHRLSAESLAGRIEIYNLRPFNLREVCRFANKLVTNNTSLLDAVFAAKDFEKLVDELSPLQLVLQKALRETLIWGGLPEVIAKSTDAARLIYLANYLQTYLEKDIREVDTISDINLYKKLMMVVAEQTGSVRQDKRIIDALGCKSETLKKYRGLLAATLLYRDIYPFIDSTLKRLVKFPKGYLLDNGLIGYLTDIVDYKILEKTGLIGSRFENWFLNELQVALDRNPHHSEIYFWRTSTGMEVDFVVQIGKKIYPFEVTCNAKPDRKKIRNLTSFMQVENARIGFYVYNGEYKFDEQQKICFLPAWMIG